MVVLVVLVVVVVEVVEVVGCGGAVGSGRGSVMVEASSSSILSRHDSTFSSMKLFMNPKIRVSTYTNYPTQLTHTKSTTISNKLRPPYL